MSGRREEEREDGKEVGREGNGGGWGEVVANNPLYDGGVISLLCENKEINNKIILISVRITRVDRT